jgi:hypothetical protein
MEAQMGDTITIEAYLGLLKYQFQHDQKLLKYFQDKNEVEKAKLVAERIPLIIAEMEEAIDIVKKKK